MKAEIDFTEYNEIDVFLASLKSREFDVRAASTTNLNAVNELRIGTLGLKRPPYVTLDGVVIDGRHLVDAWSQEVPKPAEIRARQFIFSWSELSSNQQDQVKAWALEQNLPDKNGYRQLAVTEDVTLLIKEYIRRGRGRPAIRELLRAVPSAQFDVAYQAAYTSVKQSLFYAAKQRMAEDEIGPKAAAASLPKPMQAEFIQSFKGKPKSDDSSPTASKAGAKAIRDKQVAIDSALIAVGGYTDSLLNKIGEPGHSPAITQSVLSYHRTTIERLKVKFEEGAESVEKAILAYNATLTRNTPRRP